MDDETKPPQIPPTTDFKRDEDFESLYANNVRFEPSVWDLKLLFGEIDQSSGQVIIDQHTAIAIPWMTAKLMAYFLEMNLVIYEADNGYIRLPRSVIPPPLDLSGAPPNPSLKWATDYLAVLHKKYFPEFYVQQEAPSQTAASDKVASGPENTDQD
jgi:hypothetical protein